MFSPIFADLGGDQLADGRVGVLDERLLEQHRLGVELLHLAVDDLVDHVGRLARGERLLAVDRALALEDLGGHFVALDVARLGRRDVHRDVACTSSWKSSVRATKSVSQLTSTSTPILPPAWM